MTEGEPEELEAERQETLPIDFAVRIDGWETDDEEAARTFGHVVLAWVKAMSKYLDLSRLEAVVIAWDYRAALAGVDRGDLPPAAPTANEYGDSGAMALPVIRDGQPWNVVVIWTGLVRPLAEPEDPGHAIAKMTLVHELVHVDDLRLFDRTFPGGWQEARSRDAREGTLLEMVNACQSEYSAQRRSAWAAPEHGLDLLDMLGNAMRDVEAQIREARVAYRFHGQMDVYWPIVCERTRFLFQALGYALGHADWLADAEVEHPELAQRSAGKLRELGELPAGWMIDACRDAVLPVYEVEEWSGLDVYEPLKAVAERFLNERGMFTKADGESVYIDMPYTGFHDF